MILINSEGDAQAKYQVLRIQLENLKALLVEIYVLSSWKAEVENLERSHIQTLELFQTEFIDQDSSELLTQYYVEINKQLRLLGADIKLLKISRQTETLHKRINQAGDRLTLLLTYCDRIVEMNG